MQDDLTDGFTDHIVTDCM